MNYSKKSRKKWNEEEPRRMNAPKKCFMSTVWTLMGIWFRPIWCVCHSTASKMHSTIFWLMYDGFYVIYVVNTHSIGMINIGVTKWHEKWFYFSLPVEVEWWVRHRLTHSEEKKTIANNRKKLIRFSWLFITFIVYKYIHTQLETVWRKQLAHCVWKTTHKYKLLSHR